MRFLHSSHWPQLPHLLWPMGDAELVLMAGAVLGDTAPPGDAGTCWPLLGAVWRQRGHLRAAGTSLHTHWGEGSRGLRALPGVGAAPRAASPPTPAGVSRDVPADGCFWGWPGATGHGMRAACLPEPRCTAGLDSGAGWEMRFGLKFGVPRPWGAPWHYVVCFRVNPLLACSSLRPPSALLKGSVSASAAACFSAVADPRPVLQP